MGIAVLLVLNATLGNKQIDAALPHGAPVGGPQFVRSVAGALGGALAPGNQVETLANGDEIFPAILGEIAAAQRSITFETYIYWSGDVGRRTAQALAERAAAGVAVHLMLDWVGGRLDDSQLDLMHASGVRIVRYNPPRLSRLHRLNNRTHRKLIVVDGLTGFIGGAGIADEWAGHAQDPDHWRDTHYRVRGPAVAQLQSAFTDNWLQATGEVLQGEAYFPELPAVGDVPARVFTSSPGGGAESMQLMMLLAIAGATRTLDLATPYFLPDEVAVQMLVAARKRGVRVRILVPGPYMDVDVVRRASRASWGPLLEAGVEIHEYRPTMLHWKLLVADGRWTSVGSANFDDRSFAINDEANMNVLDEAFARRQLALFEQDLQRSDPVLLQAWSSRPLVDKVLDTLAVLLKTQL
jgi:cardiolipin synthase